MELLVRVLLTLNCLRNGFLWTESVKKNGYFTVRLTVRVDPLSLYGQFFCEFFWRGALYLGFWSYGFWDEFCTPPHLRQNLHELTTWKIHHLDPFSRLGFPTLLLEDRTSQSPVWQWLEMKLEKRWNLGSSQAKTGLCIFAWNYARMDIPKGKEGFNHIITAATVDFYISSTHTYCCCTLMRTASILYCSVWGSVLHGSASRFLLSNARHNKRSLP